MALDRITLSAFRNHRATRIEGARHINLLVGENGAGKTNVLEAISLFAPGRGLRRAALADMAAERRRRRLRRQRRSSIARTIASRSNSAPAPTRAKPGRRLVQVNGADDQRNRAWANGWRSVG